MIFLVLPCNYYSGWGVCSTNLAKELAKKTQIKYVSTELQNSSENEIEYAFFKSHEFTNFDFLKKQKDHPLIQAVQHDLSEYMEGFTGSPNICLTFADRKIPQKFIEQSKKFDFIIAGSTWGEKLLKNHNIPSKTIQQGIDPILFNKTRSKKEIFLDDFVVFSGGKFEFRKGQDVTIKAYKVLQDRHPDVKLICAWSNYYTEETGKEALKEAKIDLNRVIYISGKPNWYFPQIYQNTDVGIFPSRCEAGTNLVLMEYMACGKPAIATIETGQADLINESTGISIPAKGFIEVIENKEIVAYWENPDVDSVVESLEWTYNNRNKARIIGINAAKMLKNYTWEIMTQKILDLL